jgi:hypothetical protein
MLKHYLRTPGNEICQCWNPLVQKILALPLEAQSALESIIDLIVRQGTSLAEAPADKLVRP